MCRESLIFLHYFHFLELQPPNNPVAAILAGNGVICCFLFSCSVMSKSLQPPELHHTRRSCYSPSPRACSISCPLSQCCHPTISSSVIPFSSCLLSFPASGSFLVSQFFASGGQSIGVSASASVLPMIFRIHFL